MICEGFGGLGGGSVCGLSTNLVNFCVGIGSKSAELSEGRDVFDVSEKVWKIIELMAKKAILTKQFRWFVCVVYKLDEEWTIIYVSTK